MYKAIRKHPRRSTDVIWNRSHNLIHDVDRGGNSKHKEQNGKTGARAKFNTEVCEPNR